MKLSNKFWGQTAIYGLGYLLVRAVSFLLLPLYTNLLTPSETGFIFLFLTLLAFLNTFYNMGMDSALLKFYDKEKFNVVFSSSILYSLILGAVWSLILFVFCENFEDSFSNYSINVPNNITACLIGILMFDAISSRTKVFLRLMELPFYYLAVSFCNVFSSAFLSIYFIGILNMGVKGAINALLITSFIQFLTLLPILIIHVRPVFLDVSSFKKMIKFGFPFLPASIFFIIIELSDRWMIEWIRGLDEVGLYGSGYKIGSLIMMLVLGFNLNWQPHYLKQKDGKSFPQLKKIGNLFIMTLTSTTWFLCLLGPLLLAVDLSQILPLKLFFQEPVYIIGKIFWDGFSVIPIICFGYIFYGVFITQMPSIYLKDKQNWIPFLWGTGAFLNIILNYMLIDAYGFYGASIATLVTYLFMALILSFKNLKWMNISLNYKILGPYLVLVFLIVSPLQWNNNLFILMNAGAFVVGVFGFKKLLENKL